jgi:hypothetical protein
LRGILRSWHPTLDHGFVEWPGDIDLAPDAMYDEIKALGVWILE